MENNWLLAPEADGENGGGLKEGGGRASDTLKHGEREKAFGVSTAVARSLQCACADDKEK